MLKNEKEIDLIIPDIGDNDQIELLKWNFNIGDSFEEGDELCDLVTDKAAFALEAPQNGKIIEINQNENSVVKIGQVVGRCLIQD